MKVIKPQMLGFLSRTLNRNGNRLALTGLVYFDFDRPNRPVPEPDMWKTLAGELPPDTIFDDGMPKEQGEVLLSARCFAPDQRPIAGRTVSIAVGGILKSLSVVGNRFWEQKAGQWVMTDPEPFTELPIIYNNAFGGEGFPRNPLGKGFISGNPDSSIPLPNIESRTQPVRSIDDRPEPAGFGPMAVTWPQRFLKIGQYAPGELDGKHFPPMPANTDWHFTNQAPEDQRATAPWTGGESFVLEGLHPVHDRLKGHLPSLRLRSFVTLSGPEGDSFLEVPLAPETVWIFPHLEMGVIVHRGSIPIETDDGSEITTVLLAAEDPGEVKPVAHYKHFQNRRMARSGRDFDLFSDTPLLPERLVDDPEANLGNLRYQASRLPPDENDRRQRIRERMFQKVEDEIRDRESAGSPPEGGPSDGAGAGNDLQVVRQKIADIKASLAQNAGANPIEELEQALSRHRPTGSPELSPEDRLDHLLDSFPEELKKRANIDTGRGRRPQPPPKNQAAASPIPEELLSWLTKNPLDDHPEISLNRDELKDRLDHLSDRVSSREQGDLLSKAVHHFGQPPPDPVLALRNRQWVIDELPHGKDFTRWDLRGADLTDLDLSECLFSECDLIGADFSRSNLTGARFDGAWLSHSRFVGATLHNSSFSRANLGHANLTAVAATHADFSGSILSGATLVEADLSQSRFDEADLSDLRLKRTNASRIFAPNARFLSLGLPHPDRPRETDSPSEDTPRLALSEIDFSGANLEKVLFMNTDFTEADFSGCRLVGMIFLDCTGPGSRFDKASMVKALFVNCRDFSRSSFREADLSNGNLRGLALPESDLTQSRLLRVDGSGANLRQANLTGVEAAGSRFIKADLQHADCRGGDFRQALFLKADLRFADFRLSSVYKAAFIGAIIDESTRINGALTQKTILATGKESS